jgi:hypothetical protein
MPTTGTLSLFIEGEMGRRGHDHHAARQLLARRRGAQRRERLRLSRHDDYPGTSRYAFTGETIKQAIVDVSADQYIDYVLEALALTNRE